MKPRVEFPIKMVAIHGRVNDSLLVMVAPFFYSRLGSAYKYALLKSPLYLKSTLFLKKKNSDLAPD
jgi:hypothetical protein